MICPSKALGQAILACFFEGLRVARARPQANRLACQGVTMQLDDQQKKTVAGWIEEGLDLSAIQARLESELNISITYMDVRFLVGDLELMPRDEEESADEEDDEVEAEPVGAMPGGPTPDDPFPAPDDPMADAPTPAPDEVLDGEMPEPSGVGDVSISVSPVTKPGMMASGSVTFSDGVTCDWYLDQFGRPGLVPPAEGYRPPEADMSVFGQKLQEALQGGY
tara:strand:- start:230 stop:895 length:666 start_codon:yes stop_codon:yes gene_type:complete